jgi:Cu/Zn superoxide dismutase
MRATSTRFLRWSIVAVGAVALVLAAAGLAEKRAEAALITINVTLSGANEVPPLTGPGAGSAQLTFNDATKELKYTLHQRGLSANLVTAAHIHRGAAGTNGPVVYALATAGFDDVAGSITLTDADVSDLRAGNFYLNIHSTGNPAGFARGQIVLPGGAAGGLGAPRTGDGGLVGQEQGRSAPLYGLAAFALAAFGAIALRARRRA